MCADSPCCCDHYVLVLLICYRALYQQFVTEIIVNPHTSEGGGDSGALVDHVSTRTHTYNQNHTHACTHEFTHACTHECTHAHAHTRSVVHCAASLYLLLPAQPLNPNPESAWSKYFKDNEQLLQIDHDCRFAYTMDHHLCTLLHPPLQVTL